MHKTLIFTDIHMAEAGQTIIGLDPKERFERVLAHALAHHPDATRVVILGDLTHHGTASEYARVQSVLEACAMPVTLTIGNHDTRAEMAQAFGSDALTDGFAQQAWAEADTLFLLLDTVDEDGHAPKHGGWICDARLAWVSDQISAHKAKKIVAMMHHPPFETGFPGMDRINLNNGQALLDILKRAAVPTHLICGHVHRTMSGMVQGFPFSILKSPCHQMPMNLNDPNSGLSIDEPGAYGVLVLKDQQVILHSEDVFAASPPVSVDSASE